MPVRLPLGLALVPPDLLGARGDERVELVRGQGVVAVRARVVGRRGRFRGQSAAADRRRRAPPILAQGGRVREAPRAHHVVVSAFPGGDRQADRRRRRNRITQVAHPRGDFSLVLDMSSGLESLTQFQLAHARVVDDRPDELALHSDDEAVDLDTKVFDAGQGVTALLKLGRGVFPAEVREVADRRTPGLAQAARVAAAVQIRGPYRDGDAFELELILDLGHVRDEPRDGGFPLVAQLGLDCDAGEAEVVLLAPAEHDEVGLKVGQLLDQRATRVEEVAHQTADLGRPAERLAGVRIGKSHDLGHANDFLVFSVGRLAAEVEVVACLLRAEDLEHQQEQGESHHGELPHPPGEDLRRHVIPLLLDAFGLVVLPHLLPTLGLDRFELAVSRHETVSRLPVVVHPILRELALATVVLGAPLGLARLDQVLLGQLFGGHFADLLLLVLLLLAEPVDLGLESRGGRRDAGVALRLEPCDLLLGLGVEGHEFLTDEFRLVLHHLDGRPFAVATGRAGAGGLLGDLLLLLVEALNDVRPRLAAVGVVPVGVGLGLVSRGRTAGGLQLLDLRDPRLEPLVDVLQRPVAHDVLRDEGLALEPIVDLRFLNREDDRHCGGFRNQEEQKSTDDEHRHVRLPSGVRHLD